MTDAEVPDAEQLVVVPAGAPILDAAGWVGHACWAELRFHAILTDWLALEADPELRVSLWSIRAHRAELAEAWHRRLPELRELPRADFVRGTDQAEAGFASLEALTDPAAGAARITALHGALAAMADHYRAHVPVAVGPADRPTADTLSLAIARTESDATHLAPTPATGSTPPR